MDRPIGRRSFLAGAAAASALSLTDLRAFAGPKDSDQRLAVIVLRGAMDGLHVVPPLGDPMLLKLRPAAAKALDLDGFYGLDPTLEPLLPLFRREELGFVHAVSSPYRSRSHFDGQDALENGTASADGAPSGWLNRAVARMAPSGGRQLAVNVGSGSELILRGPAKVGVWHPRSDIDHVPEVQQFHTAMYEGRPHFEQAYSEALMLDDGRDGALGGAGRIAERAVRLAGRLLSEEARVVAFSINGWDTHLAIDRAARAPMKALAAAVLMLRDSLGPLWENTTIVAISEFGRTVRLNGTAGTDHGTGGAMLIAGGGVRGFGGGKVTARWPGLAERDLLDGRDLRPTDDMRRPTAHLLSRSLGLDRAALEGSVFPGLDMGQNPFG